MNESHAVQGLAVWAHSWLSDPSSVYLNALGLVADIAAEEGLSHLRQEGGGPDHHPTYGDQLINVCRGNQGRLL